MCAVLLHSKLVLSAHLVQANQGTSFNSITYLCPIGLAVRSGNTECTDTGCLGTVYRYRSKCTDIPEPTQGAELSLSVCLSLTRTHMHARAHTHTHTHTRAHTHAHTHIMHVYTSPLHPLSDVSFSLLLPTRHLIFLPSFSLCLSLLPICPWQRNKEPSKPGVEVKLLTVALDIRREREQITAALCTPVYRCKILVLG